MSTVDADEPDQPVSRTGAAPLRIALFLCADHMGLMRIHHCSFDEAGHILGSHPNGGSIGDGATLAVTVNRSGDQLQRRNCNANPLFLSKRAIK
ncbi:hypothetical protein [Pseudomonas sp. NPDC086278]|uniref:hypothetical protein n=1 Tax=Pseudomonas sp. NPDC086278 TaxID=3390646 RepID=UPI003D00A94F